MLLLGIVQCTTHMAFHSNPASKHQISSTNTSWMSASCSAPGYTLTCKVLPSRDSLNTCLINWLFITLSLLSWNFLVSHILPWWKRLCSFENLAISQEPTKFPSVPTSAPFAFPAGWNKDKSPPPLSLTERAVHKRVWQCHIATFPSSVWIIALSRITYHTFNT